MATIKIPIDGVDIEVPQWATEETLALLAKELGVKGVGGLKDIIATVGKKGSKDPKTFTGAIGGASHSLDEVSKSGKLAQTAFNAFQGTVNTFTGAGAALINMKGSFEDLNPIIDIATDLLGSFAKMLPIVGDGVAGLMGVAGDLMKTANSVFQETVDAFDIVAKQGMGLQTSLLDISIAATEGGLGITDLFEATQKAAGGITAMGGSFDAGVQKFIQTQTLLADTDGPFGKAMMAFGMGAVDTAEFLGEFIETQKGNLFTSQMSTEQLAKVTFDLAKNQRIVAELTGQQADDLEEERRKLAIDAAFQSRLQIMRNKGQTAEAEAIQRSIAMLPTDEAKQAAKELLEFGGAATEGTGLLFEVMGPAFEKGLNDMLQRAQVDPAGVIANTAANVAPLLDIQAQLATNNEMLAIGALGILDDVPAISQMIQSQVANSKLINEIIEKQGKTSAETALTLLTEAANVSEAFKEGGDANTAVVDFNKSLITTRKNIEMLGPTIESTILAGSESLMEAYATSIDVVVGELTGLANAIKDGTIDDYVASKQDSFKNYDNNLIGKQKGEDTLEYVAEILAPIAAGATIGAVGGPAGIAVGAGVGVVVAIGTQIAEAIFGNDLGGLFAPDENHVPMGTKTSGGGHPSLRAFGGPAFPGKSYLVGEMGPEMFTPKTAGTVSSNRTMTNTANQSGTGPELGATLTKAFSQLDTQSRVESQLIKMNRNLSRILPKAMETDGIY